MFSDSKMEDLKHHVPNQSDDEILIGDGFSQSTGSHRRVKMWAAVLVLAGVVVGAVVTNQRSIPKPAVEKNFDFDQKWECVHWTPSDNMARRANANERRLCENKGNLNTNSQYVYKPFGLTCQGGCHCCTRQRWSCAPWTSTEQRALESNADERLLCENKVTNLRMFKYKPNGKTCGNGGGCLCCMRKMQHATITALVAPATLNTAVCSKVQVQGVAAPMAGDYEVTTCAPAKPHEPGTKVFSLNGDTSCKQTLYLPAAGTKWLLEYKTTTPALEYHWESKASTPKTKMPVDTAATSWTNSIHGTSTMGVLPKFACAA